MQLRLELRIGELDLGIPGDPGARAVWLDEQGAARERQG